MAASKYAERLIILCDHAVGVQARLHSLVDYKRPALFAKDGEIDKFARLFLKKFPAFPDTLQKEKGADIFKKRAPEITSALADYYYTFLEVLNFTEEAWKLLAELAGAIQEFKYDLNMDLLSYYFHLFTRYVQIHFLVHLIDTPQLFLASYARAYHHTSGNTEPSFARIADYLAAFKPASGAGPLKKMQDDAQAISLCIGNTLMTFLPLVTKYSSVAGYMAQGKLFNVLQEDAKNLTWATNEKLQLEVVHLSNMRAWVLWGFLVCPGELCRPGALDLLSLCLRETFSLQICRDKCLSIHKEFDEQIDYKNASGTFKLSKHKKVFKDAYSDDEGTRKFHQDLRTYLRTELDIFDTFFSECPSVLPAKLSMVLALLALARNEVVWFFRHQHVIPFKCSSSKIKGLPWDPQISDMIYRVLRIQKLIEANKKEIQAHHVEWLTTRDAERARTVSEQFLSTVSNQALAQLTHAMIDHLHERQAGDNLESIRLNWYRISATLAHSQSGIPIQSAKEFSIILNRVVQHSRHIDCIDTQLKTLASFQLLFFYKQDVFDALKATLTSVDGRAIHCMSFVSTLTSAMHNVHKLCPDEQPLMGRESCMAAIDFIKVIVQSLERCIQGIVSDTLALRSRTNHTAVLKRIEHINAMALNPTGMAPLGVPGDESQYSHARQVQNLACYHKAISDICASIAALETVVVYNHEFIAREYVHDALTALMRGAILDLCVRGPAIQKPTVILSRLKDTIAGMANVERALNFNVQDIVRDVLLSELSPSPEEIAALHAAEVDPNRHMPIIMHVAHFYASMFSQDLAATQGIVYSTLKKCFVSTRRAAAQQAANSNAPPPLDFERFTDVSELRALCTLIGPAGVAVIERGLLKQVTRFTKAVKEVLLSNQTALLNLSNRFTEQSVWLDNIGILSNMDQLCSALTCIGCILHFRRLLREALQHVTQQASPFVFQAVALAHRAVHDAGVVVDPRLLGIDNSAADVGLDVGEADHPLRLALAPLKTTVADMNMLSFLPELFGLMYLSARWRSAVFSIELEGHTNNLHCAALAIRHLLVQFARLHVKDAPPQIDIERKITADLERFVRCSAFTILHLKVLNAMKETPHGVYPLPHIMAFLELCVQTFAGRVDGAVLEQCFPFTMLRTNAIQVYEKQTNIHSSAPTAADEPVE